MSKASIKADHPPTLAVVVQEDGAISDERLIKPGRQELPYEVARKLLDRGDARPVPRYTYVALDNVIIGGTRCFDRGQRFTVEEPVPAEFAGKVLELGEAEAIPNPLPDPETDDHMWMVGPMIQCEVLPGGTDTIRSAPVGGTVTLREQIALDFWATGRIRLVGHLTSVGRQYVIETNRTNERADYVSLARAKRRQPQPPLDAAGAAETVAAVVRRPCEIDGMRRMPDERIVAFAWEMTELWTRGAITLESRPSSRFSAHADAIKEFLSDPDAKYPTY
jgi:hypothetical protein